ncbi:hypothetical protein SAMN05421644_1782 [Allochromatium warmingii]|uniref:Uncharacterized protein n=1 Tax=Allochromatium warmingii TaxID=61595 RepID=A0A1H3K5U0_ALLWA|nr:hypothetical protein SAMN05421644_1782 [Allochromatium warmingii]
MKYCNLLSFNMHDKDRIRFLHMIEAAEDVCRFIEGRQRSELVDTSRSRSWSFVTRENFLQS